VILACVEGVALAGMFIGFYDTVTPVGQPGYATVEGAQSIEDSTNIPQSVVYSEMTGARFGPNANWESPWPGSVDDPTEYADAVPVDAGERDAANAQRAQRRAYSGAPPVVPHAIDQMNAASCLVCHGEGIKVGQVVAPKMSHESYANCTQCHVESTNRALPPTTGPRSAATLFEGLEAPGPGERAWPGAPPIIPHTTWMRENCNSCHGELADKGLRTSHPWRINCVQCHAPSAAMDQWRVLSADRPPVMMREEVSP
jgi:nitrate reductase (cytochrome), electron transfer subunit